MVSLSPIRQFGLFQGQINPIAAIFTVTGRQKTKIRSNKMPDVTNETLGENQDEKIPSPPHD